MAQTNFTPISLYHSTTAAAVPTSGNLVAGELALNTNDEKLYFKNSTGVVKQLAGAGVGGVSYTAVKTANYTAVNNDGVLTNTTGGAFTVTLPTSPSVGNIVVVVDSFSQWGTNNLTIDPTALIKIANNTAGDTLVCDITGVTVTLVYTGATYGWNVSAQIGGNGGTAVTLDGVQTLTNKTLTAPESTGAIYDNGSVRGNVVAVAALDIDCSAGNYFTKTINGASTFTFSNAPSSRSYAFTLELTVTSGAATWPAAVQWPGGTAPTLGTSKTSLLMFVTDDGGTRWRGASLVDYTT